MRHLVVFSVVYTIMAARLPRMEGLLLRNALLNVSLYSELQNFVQIRTNGVKAACLLCIWPFAVHAGPTVFVELGCFSMACFAIACDRNASIVRAGASKLFWYTFLTRKGIRTPRIIAWYDDACRLRVGRCTECFGVRKPDRGMYGIDVRRQTLKEFRDTPRALDIFQTEVRSWGNTHGRSYRICSFRCRRRGVRVISIFVITLRRYASVDAIVWNALVQFGKQVLCRVHEQHFPSVPLIGWDVMYTDEEQVVVLEGNFGGSVGVHLVPFLTEIGAVDPLTARTWCDDLRDSHGCDYYGPRTRSGA